MIENIIKWDTSEPLTPEESSAISEELHHTLRVKLSFLRSLRSLTPGSSSSAGASVTPETSPSSEPSSTSSPPRIPSSPPSFGLRYNAGKLPLELFPPEAAIAISAVLREGAKKYAERNWELGMDWEICYACAMRHLYKWQLGEERDEESGLPHLWHALTNIAFLVTYSARAIGRDNRPKLTYPSLKELFSCVAKVPPSN